MLLPKMDKIFVIYTLKMCVSKGFSTFPELEKKTVFLVLEKGISCTCGANHPFFFAVFHSNFVMVAKKVRVKQLVFCHPPPHIPPFQFASLDIY